MKIVVFTTCAICGEVVASESEKTTRCPEHQNYQPVQLEREPEHHPTIAAPSKYKRRYRGKRQQAEPDPAGNPDVFGLEDFPFDSIMAAAQEAYHDMYRAEDHI